MPSRRRSRQRALQLLFLWDARRQPLDDVFSAYYDALYADEHPARDTFAADLVQGAIEHIAELDDRIARHAEHWRMERMAAVDRNLLRAAVAEFLAYPETPRAVVINEALEIARKFSTPESVHFVNGVLDSIGKELETKSSCQ